MGISCEGVDFELKNTKIVKLNMKQPPTFATFCPSPQVITTGLNRLTPFNQFHVLTSRFAVPCPSYILFAVFSRLPTPQPTPFPVELYSQHEFIFRPNALYVCKNCQALKLAIFPEGHAMWFAIVGCGVLQPQHAQMLSRPSTKSASEPASYVESTS
jgi:hypothetical protein